MTTDSSGLWAITEKMNVPQMRRLVIIAPNWVGDSAMAQPAMADLRRARAAETLVVIARASVMPVFSMMAEIDEVLPLERKGVLGTSRLGRNGSRSFDAALLLPNSLHAAVLAFRAGIPQRWGYR